MKCHPVRSAVRKNAARALSASPCFLRHSRSRSWRRAAATTLLGTPRICPPNGRRSSIPAFKNDTTRYRIEQRFTEATIREFITRTKYHVVQDPASADAVLHGEVLSIDTTPVLFNATTGEVTTMLVTVHTKISLVDNHTQKPVYQDKDMVFRDQYQISADVNSFFEQQDPALERMSRDLASHIVANVLEGF